jgi:hypothetical protein
MSRDGRMGKPKHCMKPTKVRIINWLNRKTMKIEYGIDVKVEDKWHHTLEDGKPIIYKDKTEAVKKKRQLQQEYGLIKPM